MLTLSLVLFFASCNQIETELPEPFTISKDGKVFTISSQDNLVDFVKYVEKTKGIDVTNVALEDFDHETYTKVVKGKYLTKEKETVTFMIFMQKVDELSKVAVGALASFRVGCSQKCKAKNGCCGCDQTVTAPCVSQICNCKDSCNVPGKDGSCSAETSF